MIYYFVEGNVAYRIYRDVRTVVAQGNRTRIEKIAKSMARDSHVPCIYGRR